ncbi:hypothetical protein J3R82DRAFT_11254, partial [Butyriboletus roseoflavus]
KLEFMDSMFINSCINVKSAEVYGTENPLWICRDSIYRELGTCLCSIQVIHGI